MLKFLLATAPFILIGLSALPKILIQRRDAKLDNKAIVDFRDTLAQEADRGLTFEERWDAADDEFMKTWSSFCSRDLWYENQQLLQHFAEESEEVIQRTADRIRWTYDAFATYFIRVDTTVELAATYLVMKADGVDFDALRERADPMNDTTVWTEAMENELRALLDAEKEEEKEEVKV